MRIFDSRMVPRKTNQPPRRRTQAEKKNRKRLADTNGACGFHRAKKRAVCSRSPHAGERSNLKYVFTSVTAMTQHKQAPQVVIHRLYRHVRR